MDLRVGSRIEHLEAEDLDAAGGGASAAADEHEGKHEGQHEAAPGSVVGGGEAAAGHDGDDVEGAVAQGIERPNRSEEHTSELQSLMRHSYAVFRLKKKKRTTQRYTTYTRTVHRCPNS